MKQVMNDTTILVISHNTRKITDVFPDLTKTLLMTFSWTLFKGDFLNLNYYNLVWGLPIHTRFNDLKLVSGTGTVCFV